MRPSRTVVFLLLFLLPAFPLVATIGTIDVVPAATILIPYFEVDLGNPNGLTTVINIQNFSASAMLVNMTLWTDYGIATENANIYLTGYDAQTIDMRELFLARGAPRTATAGQDPTDTISHHGMLSQDINFATCAGFLPSLQDDWIAPDLIAAHRGEASPNYFGDLCASHNYGDGHVRGFVTIDSLTQCTTMTPASPGYFEGWVADARNILLGDYAYVDAEKGMIIAHPAVHIEATDPWMGGPFPFPYSFYGRFVAWTGADRREPLPVAWNGSFDPARTTIHYWRDPGQVVAPFECGNTPAPFPLAQKQFLGFDSEENVFSPAGDYFPWAAGTVSPGTIPLGFKTGWLFTSLNLPAAAGPMGAVRQSWLTFERTMEGLPSTTPFEIGWEVVQRGNAGADPDPSISSKGATR